MLILKSVVKNLYLQPFSKYFHRTTGCFTNSWRHGGINQSDRRSGGQSRNTDGFREGAHESWNTIICQHTQHNAGFLLMHHSMQLKNESPSPVSCEPIVTEHYGNVCSVLEFCCTVWGGTARVHLDRIEKVQHRFLVWLARYARSFLVTGTASYHVLLHAFHMTSLEHRRLQYNIMFAKKKCSRAEWIQQCFCKASRYVYRLGRWGPLWMEEGSWRSRSLE